MTENKKGLLIDGTLFRNDGSDLTLEEFIIILEEANIFFGGGSLEIDYNGQSDLIEMIDVSDEEEEELGFNIEFEDGVPQWDKEDDRFSKVFDDDDEEN